jgi:TetR/AcrR family transcriptional regulator, transcriptional repressor for nem operon
MPRPRNRSREEIVAAARDVFWEHGYEGTALSELERRTGVNRSSLYSEFGSKEALFSEVLDLYYEEVTEPLISRLEADPSIDEIAAFFAGVKRVMLEDEAGDRCGCLLINTIAELSPRDDSAARRGVEFRDRLLRAFQRALESEDGGGSATRRANMLLASTLGVWVAARIDVDDAAERCDEISAEARSWVR